MRLEPINDPSSIFVKIAYWYTRRKFGRVISPLKVVYSRKPELLDLTRRIARFEEKQTSLNPAIRVLIKVATATQNGCSFCQDIGLAKAVQSKLGTEKFRALIDRGGTRDIFDESEWSILQAVDEYNTKRKVSAATFNNLKRSFSDTQIIEIFALNAFEHFYNAINVPLEIGSDGLSELDLRRA